MYYRVCAPVQVLPRHGKSFFATATTTIAVFRSFGAEWKCDGADLIVVKINIIVLDEKRKEINIYNKRNAPFDDRFGKECE